MQSSSTFIRISGPIPEVKKSTLIIDYEKYHCIFGRVRAKRGVGEQLWFVSIHLGGLRVGANHEKFGYFYSHLSLETVLPALKLTQNSYINVNKSFS